MPPATSTYTPASNPTAFRVNSPNIQYTDCHILADYMYRNTRVTKNELGEMLVEPIETRYQFKTDHRVPKVGLMLVGWGGNNGSTVTASILANRRNIQWRTKEGMKSPNYFGSVVLSSTLKIGIDETGKDVFIPFHDILPMAHPNHFVIGGWDINSANLAEAMERSQVLDVDLQRQLYDELAQLKPLPSVYFPSFIAANQEDRADNVLQGTMKEQLDELRKNIREFKSAHGLDKVVVLWTANTERFAEVLAGVNDTAENLQRAVEEGHSEISPSTLFAMASVLEGSPFINGSPQNTLVPGVVELAERHRVFIGGDDFKTGQTKVKSVLVDFLVNAGIKPVAITSYNHLGNNDGKNLSAPEQFRSKEISKSNVVDDMVAANHVLYKKGEHPDHVVVIKYVPSVSDSKRALDEYVSEIFMNGRNTIALYNTCEDSLLAAPLIIDLAIITELMTRIEYKTGEMEEYAPFHSVLSILSYMLKAPVVPKDTPVVNALSKQRMAMENVFRACVGLPPQNEMLLEHKAIQ
ncbi:Myo-inositol-1-phosphate synthase [Basidiobolus meristosporus CBS 931.73]|uniref:inositol-3-phosphate synthase n=1 Tax=Basidiobolus meristosporus CBS 931.73 TaxID=1314790 RepID=A0A1Y1VVZ1_9FUNG|nr:Myo-inositol-1-phosphate synthase [Basidiobolus meristosporus CBS 931.73]|eukprot:ORX65450.1 Myo-inositol-1-phosphate synthase [Basidiobolus meristosporus CBS 931.73]